MSLSNYKNSKRKKILESNENAYNTSALKTAKNVLLFSNFFPKFPKFFANKTRDKRQIDQNEEEKFS